MEWLSRRESSPYGPTVLPPGPVPMRRGDIWEEGRGRALAPTVELRPLDLADGAAAYAVAEAALRGPEATEGAAEDPLLEVRQQQRHWDDGMRLWSGWLQAHAAGNAWGAVLGAGGPLVGYARAVRDPAARMEYLMELFVLPGFQARHIGQKLLRAVLPPDVPPGWRRLIVAHPLATPLALYHRWSTFPLATAWYIAGRPASEGGRVHGGHREARKDTEGTESRRTRSFTKRHEGDAEGLRPLDPWRDLAALEWLDRMVLGRTRGGQHQFMLGIVGATGIVLERDGAIAAYGLRTGDQIGPVVGETALDSVRVLRALFHAALAAGGALPGCWVPGANITALAWLRASGMRLILAGQVTLMASDPDLTNGMDRAILTAPPYLG